MESKSTPISRAKHQLTMVVFKWLPAVMAFSYLFNVICAHLQVGWQVVTHYLGLVIAPMAFLYIASYVFKFCWYHRLFIHYVAFVELLNITDYYIGIPISNTAICVVHYGVTAIFLIVAIATFFIKRPKKKGSD